MLDKSSVEKEIVVVTEQEVVKNTKATKEPPEGKWRRWKVSIYAIDETGEKCPLTFVEKVEYNLHQTFSNPRPVVYKAPFLLAETGWGEFDMKIVLHFVDKNISPWPIYHDLNFQKPLYEVPYTLKFVNPGPSFRKLLFQEIPLDSPASQKTTPSRQKKSKSSTSVSKWQRTDSPVTSTYESPQSSRSSCSIGEFTNDKENCQVDYNKLAKNLYDLEGDDILEVIHLVKEHRTGDMYINEDTEGEFHLDLHTLGDDLLQILWDFTESKLLKTMSY
ncbi:38059_t:CDS:2 [Gigaspora margarita]|uniref:38059_t:CDS:1 n=1 Tax=Gigaspora margarita TaxID=4874 RepID=A0ABM8W3A1_GIGMA|nr:38059_t:CDS:2 [Gigaspora margarita]